MKRPGCLLISILLYAVLAAGICSGDEYRVGPGDVLDITVYDNDDLKTKVRVSNSGQIIMPLIGQVEVGGMSVSEISGNIVELLADGYLVNPQVNVFITEHRSRKVVVLGMVRNPGLVELTGPITFLELISKAGGLAKEAGDTATIKRVGEGDDKIIAIDLISLIEGGDLSQNVPIRDGDTVVVAKAGSCYVTGEVKEPGSYPCGEGSTVLKLVALAEGFTGKAAESKVKIVRVIGDKKTILEDVDLETTVVYDNDVIVVPESFF
jgi:polysaccharide export outer membrane protein